MEQVPEARRRVPLPVSVVEYEGRDGQVAVAARQFLVVPEKLAALADWVSSPTTLFAKSGRYVLLRGIHHIKLVISRNQLRKAKAYVFMVLSGAVSF